MISHAMKTYSESRIQMQIHFKFTNLKENAGKIKGNFVIRAAL